MKRLLVTLACLAAAAPSTGAQTLEHRKSSAASRAASSSRGPLHGSEARQALPLAAEGEYRWGQSGEIIELYVGYNSNQSGGILHGYLTRRSERGDPRSAPLTFPFEHTDTTDGRLQFSTKPIHGDWYSFTGKVIRGPAASPHRDGYYLLNGTLEVHLGAAQPGDKSASEEPLKRQVSLKRSGASP